MQKPEGNLPTACVFRTHWYFGINRPSPSGRSLTLAGRLSSCSNVQKPSRLRPVLFFAGLLFVMDALIMHLVFLSLLVGTFQVVVGLPLLFLKQDRRQRLRNTAILVGVLVMVVVLVKVNAYVAPLHADRLIEAIVRVIRAATGVYPKNSMISCRNSSTTCAMRSVHTRRHFHCCTPAVVQQSTPTLWYNPHGMDPSHLPLQDQGLGISGLTGGLVGGSH